jgi:lysozyme
MLAVTSHSDSQHCKEIKAPISKATGQALLKKDLAKFEAAVCSAVKKQKCPLNCNQFNALVSFTYNVGISGFQNSKIYEHMATKDYTVRYS